MKFFTFKSRFEKWFQELTANQVKIFWVALAISALVIFRNNPLDGYRLTYTYVTTLSMDDALAKWNAEDPYKNHCAENWKREKWYNQKVLKNDNWEPEGGYFYRKENPSWWIYAYDSNSYDKWLENDNWNATPVFRFKTLGGLINFLIFLAIAAKILMWMVDIRKQSEK